MEAKETTSEAPISRQYTFLLFKPVQINIYFSGLEVWLPDHYPGELILRMILRSKDERFL